MVTASYFIFLKCSRIIVEQSITVVITFWAERTLQHSFLKLISEITLKFTWLFFSFPFLLLWQNTPTEARLVLRLRSRPGMQESKAQERSLYSFLPHCQEEKVRLAQSQCSASSLRFMQPRHPAQETDRPTDTTERPPSVNQDHLQASADTCLLGECRFWQIGS